VYGRVTWADPNIESAALSMRRFYEEPEFLSRISVAGWEASHPQRQMASFVEAVKNAAL
jgi:hypothetical protein